MIRSPSCLGILLTVALLPSGLIGQAGVGAWYGSRSYHSGPTALSIADQPTYEASSVLEYGVDFHFFAIGQTQLTAGVNLYDASLGLDGTSTRTEIKDQVSGYGFRLSAEHPIVHFDRGAAIALRASVGLETFSIADGAEQTRGVIVGGPALVVPLSSRLDFDLATTAGTTTSSPYAGAWLPSGTENAVPWWTSLQLGLVWRFHDR